MSDTETPYLNSLEKARIVRRANFLEKANAYLDAAEKAAQPLVRREQVLGHIARIRRQVEYFGYGVRIPAPDQELLSCLVGKPCPIRSYYGSRGKINRAKWMELSNNDVATDKGSTHIIHSNSQ